MEDKPWYIPSEVEEHADRDVRAGARETKTNAGRARAASARAAGRRRALRVAPAPRHRGVARPCVDVLRRPSSARSPTHPMPPPPVAPRQDLWVSVFDRVLDLTALVAAHPGELSAPLLAAGGTDVSHWFARAPDGLPELRRAVDPATSLFLPYCPAGRFLHVPPPSPSTAEPADHLAPGGGGVWWRDPALVVGRLSRAARRVRLVNTLTSHEHTLAVAAECTLAQVQEKHLRNNAHAGGYVWKALNAAGDFAPLDMRATLEGNGLADHAEEMAALGLDPDAPDALPVLMLYYRDDLTVA